MAVNNHQHHHEYSFSIDKNDLLQQAQENYNEDDLHSPPDKSLTDFTREHHKIRNQL